MFSSLNKLKSAAHLNPMSTNVGSNASRFSVARNLQKLLVLVLVMVTVAILLAAISGLKPSNPKEFFDCQ
jgi:hypothetical protein